MKYLKRKTRILIVEDEPAIRHLLSYFLSQNYEVAAVASTEEALNMAAAYAFDVFLLDINLREERTGFDLLQALRRMSSYEDTPAVACTAYATPYNLDNFREGGFAGCVSKPFTRTSLSQTLAAVLHNPGLFHDRPMTTHHLAA